MHFRGKSGTFPAAHSTLVCRQNVKWVHVLLGHHYRRTFTMLHCILRLHRDRLLVAPRRTALFDRPRLIRQTSIYIFHIWNLLCRTDGYKIDTILWAVAIPPGSIFFHFRTRLPRVISYRLILGRTFSILIRSRWSRCLRHYGTKLVRVTWLFATLTPPVMAPP